MKSLLKAALAVSVLAVLTLASVACDAAGADNPGSSPSPSPDPGTMPLDFEDGESHAVLSKASGNGYSGDLALSIVSSQTDTNHRVVDFDGETTSADAMDASTWEPADLDPGTNQLSFEYAAKNNDGLVNLTFYIEPTDLDALTTFEMTNLFPDLPTAIGVQITLYDGNTAYSLDATSHQSEIWDYMSGDNVWLTYKLPFEWFGIDDPTGITIDRIKIAYRFHSAESGDLNTKYTGYLEGIKLY